MHALSIDSNAEDAGVAARARAEGIMDEFLEVVGDLYRRHVEHDCVRSPFSLPAVARYALSKEAEMSMIVIPPSFAFTFIHGQPRYSRNVYRDICVSTARHSFSRPSPSSSSLPTGANLAMSSLPSHPVRHRKSECSASCAGLS